MNITIEELLDYLQCPTLHKFRHIEKEDATFTGLHRGYPKMTDQSLADSFDKELHKICYHIFNYIQDGRYPTEYLLRQKWGKLWCKDKTVKDVLFEATNIDGMSKPKRLEKDGVKAIGHLHPRFKSDPGTPILVGKRVKVKVGRHTVDVVIDLVRSVKTEDGEMIEIMDFKTGIKTRNRVDQRPLNLHIEHDIQMTAASLAFRQLTGMKEDQLTYFDIVNNREYYTKRGDDDYKTLENILDHVERAMGAGIHYPVMNDRCFECPYQVQCRKRNWYKGEES
jgi:CRISPR/Cas system-associated exonuclease Cas4 (RecB family)